MNYTDLIPFDTFNTYKEIPNGVKNWPEKVVDWGIRKKGLSRFPGGDVKCNHVRIYVGVVDGIHVAFEWTYPVARFVHVEDWMLDPSYCKVMRYSRPILDKRLATKLAYEYTKQFEGSKYDHLQLVGIALGLKWLQMSEHRMVCSHGARMTQEFYFKENLFKSELWETLPCAWLNSSSFVRMNGTAPVTRSELRTFQALVGTETLDIT